VKFYFTTLLAMSQERFVVAALCSKYQDVYRGIEMFE